MLWDYSTLGNNTSNTHSEDQSLVATISQQDKDNKSAQRETADHDTHKEALFL
jgi:hypothetical protein